MEDGAYVSHDFYPFVFVLDSADRLSNKVVQRTALTADLHNNIN